MSEARFSVAEDVFHAFPDYIVAWVSAGFDKASIDAPAVSELLRGAHERARATLGATDLKDQPAIAAWRSSFSKAGWSGSKYPASVEALAKRVLRGDDVPEIHPIVDLVNASSLVYLVPIGCHDLSLTPQLAVRHATEDDQFLPMGSGEAERPDDNEIVYASGNQVRTRRWVWRQSRDALVQPDATWVFMPIDGFKETTMPNVDAAQHFLENALRDLFNAEVRSGLIDRSNTSVDLSLP